MEKYLYYCKLDKAAKFCFCPDATVPIVEVGYYNKLVSFVAVIFDNDWRPWQMTAALALCVVRSSTLPPPELSTMADTRQQ
jgi:hypothetical protein